MSHCGGTRQRVFYFFRNFFAGCQVMGHPAKNFFFEKVCRVPGPGHPAKPQKLIFFILFFDSIITNTAYKRYISHLKHHKDNIAYIYITSILSQTQYHTYISHREYNTSHTRHHKHNRSNYHRNKSIVDHSASHVHQAVKKRYKLKVGRKLSAW